MMDIIVQPGAKRPVRATKNSAGYDLSSTETVVIPPLSCKKVGTGIHFSIPVGTVGTVSHRSGMNSKQSIQAYGRIDSDYQGEIFITLFNNDTTKSVRVEDGDRVGQIVFTSYQSHTFREVESFAFTTDRGEGGFGHTGK